MKSKRRIGTAVLVSLLLFAIAACDNPAGSSGQTAENGSGTDTAADGGSADQDTGSNASGEQTSDPSEEDAATGEDSTAGDSGSDTAAGDDSGGDTAAGDDSGGDTTAGDDSSTDGSSDGDASTGDQSGGDTSGSGDSVTSGDEPTSGGDTSGGTEPVDTYPELRVTRDGAEINSDSSAVTFDQLTETSTSATETFTLHNDGDEPLTFTKIELGGTDGEDTTEPSQTGTFHWVAVPETGSLPAGESRDVQVKVEYTLAKTNVTATLTIESNTEGNGDSPLVIDLEAEIIPSIPDPIGIDPVF